MKVKRTFLILVFSMAGALAGVLVSDVLINISLVDAMYRTPIIIAMTFLFLSVSLLLTSSTGKEIQDAYWKMALLRKVIVISKKLDNVSIVTNDELNEMIDTTVDINEKHDISSVMPKIKEDVIPNPGYNDNPNLEFNNNPNLEFNNNTNSGFNNNTNLGFNNNSNLEFNNNSNAGIKPTIKLKRQI